MHLVSQEVSDIDVDSITALPHTFAERLPSVCLSFVVSEAQIEEGEVLLALFEVREGLDFLNEFGSFITQTTSGLCCNVLCFFSR